jgi:CubicO group peptidase (beta-lactamase class C family)
MRSLHLPGYTIPALLMAGLAASIPGTPAAAQEPRTSVRTLDGRVLTPAQIERSVQALMDSADVAGLALALLNDGKVVYRRAFGFANLDSKRPLTDCSTSSRELVMRTPAKDSTCSVSSSRNSPASR